jgi:hypothetical protein
MEQAALNFYSDMSNYELHDAIYTAASLVIGLYTLSLTVISAYLVVAYLAGRQLTKFQLLSISIIYSVFLLILIMLIFGQLGVIGNLLAVKGSGYDIWRQSVVPLLFLAAWILSLLFMNHSRNQGDT